MNDHLRLEVDNTQTPPKERDRKTGNEPPGGDMEARLSRVEDAIVAIRSSQDRMEQRFDGVQGSITEIKVSQEKTLERMERVMDRARDMPTPTIVDGMITSKLGLSALLMTGLGVLIAAITYAAS